MERILTLLQFNYRKIFVQNGLTRIYQHFKIVINAAFQHFDKLIIKFYW